MKRILFTIKQLRKIIAIEVQFVLAKMGVRRDGYAIAQHAVDSTNDEQIWKEYWKDNHPSHNFPSPPHICPSCLLSGDTFIGGHIVSEGEIYIVPICKKCNDTYKNDKAKDHFFYVKLGDMVRAPED